MSSDNDIVLSVKNVSKCFEMYEKPVHRLYQTLCAGKKKFYKEFWALKDISFDVHRGECVGIIGRNGAGKSTLLQIITGTLAPTSGEVKVNGRIAALLELGSGFNPEFTGKENVYLNGAILGMPKSEIDARYQDIVDFADIGEFIDQPVKTYSSGMMVRLAFAVNAFVDPDILIVDEALAVGDVAFQFKCYRKMRTILADRQKAVIFVTHDTATVKNFCTTVFWLSEGKVRGCGTPLEIVEAYLGEMLSEHRIAMRLKHISADNDKSRAANKLYVMSDISAKSQTNGDGGAKITQVGFFNGEGAPLDVVDGHQPVELRYAFKMLKDAESLHCAFQILDKQGVSVLGCSNSVLERVVGPVFTGRSYMVSFKFDFPEIANNDYTILLALNEGDVAYNIRLHNVVDAYMFKFESLSPLQTQKVLLKIPECEFDFKEDNDV